MAIMLTACSSRKDVMNLSLSDFKTDDSYCYMGMKWGTTQEEIEKLLNINLKADEVALSNFMSDKPVKLFKKEGNATFELHDDKLDTILFNFGGPQFKEDLTAFSEKIVSELEKLYGNYDIPEIKPEFNAKISRWLITDNEGIKTTVQVASFYSDEKLVNEVVIDLGVIPDS